MIGVPLFAPGVNVSLTCPAATFAALTPVGAAGAPMMTGVDAAELGLVPMVLVDVTTQR